jgi:hypothetical protein
MDNNIITLDNFDKIVVDSSKLNELSTSNANLASSVSVIPIDGDPVYHGNTIQGSTLMPQGVIGYMFYSNDPHTDSCGTNNLYFVSAQHYNIKGFWGGCAFNPSLVCGDLIKK